MTVTVKMSDLLRKMTGQQDPIKVSADTPAACLRQLVTVFPALEKWLYGENDILKSHVWLFLNDERIYQDKYTQNLTDGDEIFIMLAILGG